MTISSSNSRSNYVGNGSTTEFATGFKFLDNTHVKVYVDGVLMTLDTDFTLTGVELDSGGTVVFNIAPISQSSIVVIREVPATQEIDYISGGPFPSETHESGLDKLTMLAQEAQEAFSRSMKLDVTDVSGVDVVLPTPAPLTFFQWNETGDKLQLVTVEEITSVAVFSNFQSDMFTDGVDYTAGTSTQLTLEASAGVKNNTQVFFDGVYQEKGEYTLTAGTGVEFLSPIPPGVSSIEIAYGTALPQSDIDAQIEIANQAAADAAQSASEAAASELASGDSETAAVQAASDASTSASESAVSAGQALSSASSASSSASSASSSAGSASASKTAAETAESNAASSAQEAADSAASIDKVYLKSGRKNGVINGDFRIIQRGLSGTATTGTQGQYLCVDRWTPEDATTGMTFVRSESATIPHLNMFRDTDRSYIYAAQAIEYDHIYNVGMFRKGKTVAYSYEINPEADCKAILKVSMSDGWGDANEVDIMNEEIPVSANTWTKVTATGVVPEYASADRVIVSAGIKGGVLITAGQKIRIRQVQIEEGSYATEFEYRHIAEELALCHRYYYKIENADGGFSPIATGFVESDSLFDVVVALPDMRSSSPTFTRSGLSDFTVDLRGTNAEAITDVSLSSKGTNGRIGISVTQSGAFSGEYAGGFYFKAGSGTDSFIAFDCEL